MESIVVITFNWLASLADFATGGAIGAGIAAAVWNATRYLAQNPRGTGASLSEIRVVLGRWLALALEFALAADILRTVMVPTWDEIGKLAAIVILRTALNYFLGREIVQGQPQAELALQKAA
jgi:uncharacterized membrane protein